MSRTIRRRNSGTHEEYSWVLFPWYADVMIDPHSKEGRRILAKFHSDHANIMHGMGPKLFRSMSTHRPDRRAARTDIIRWIYAGMDPEGDWNVRMSRTYRHNVFFQYWD